MSIELPEKMQHQQSLDAMSFRSWESLQNFRKAHPQFDPYTYPPEIKAHDNVLKEIALVHHAMVCLDPSPYKEDFWVSAALHKLRSFSRRTHLSSDIGKTKLFQPNNRNLQADLLADAQVEALLQFPEYGGPVDGTSFAVAVATGRLAVRRTELAPNVVSISASASKK
jgi:hypothetical protein